MNKIICSLIIMLFAISIVSAAEWDNIKVYDAVKKEADFYNTFLGMKTTQIGTAKLNTYNKLHVAPGYSLIGEFTLTADENYNLPIKEIKFYNRSFKDWGKYPINKKYDLKYKTFEVVEVKDYGEIIIGYQKNGTAITKYGQTGSHKEKVVKWINFDNVKVDAGLSYTVGVFTTVNLFEKGEWIPTIYGVELKEWAAWTSDLNTSLRSYYKLDNNNLSDAFGNSTFDIINDGTTNTTGIIISGRDLSGTSQELEAVSTDLTGSQARSFNMWVNTDDNASYGELLVYGAELNGELFHLRQANNGSLWFQTQGGGIVLWANETLLNGVWAMVTVTAESDGTIRLYKDAVLVGQYTFSSYSFNTGTTYNLSFGNYVFDAGTEFDGQMDEIGIWTRVLNQTEITALYNGGSGLPLGDPGANAPIVTLNSPADNQYYNYTPVTVNFSCFAADPVNLTEVQLLIDDSTDQTNASGINGTNYSFSKSMTEGVYTWTCEAFNNVSFSTKPTARNLIIDATLPTFTIHKPDDPTIVYSVPNNATLNVTTTDDNLNTCWYYTSDNATNIVYTCNTAQNISFATGGNKTIYIYANDTVGNENSTSITFLFNLVSENTSYDNPTIEGENNTLYLNLTATQIDTLAATVYWNGTGYTATSTHNGTYGVLTASFLNPLVTSNQNVSMYWTYNLSGTLYNSSTYYQTVNYLTPLVVSASCTDKAINFTLKDEGNLSAIYGNIEYNFKYGVANSSLKEVYGSLTNVTEFYACINTSAAPNYTVGQGEIFYTSENYVDRRYYIFNGTILNNVFNNITLYDLLTADQTSFKLEVEDTSLNPYVDKYTALIRWYPELNEYNVVDMGLTDETGSTVIHVRTEDVDYRIAVYQKNGSLIKLADPIRMVCLVSPCTYTLKIAPTDTDFTSFLNIDYTLDYNTTTGIWTFTYSDSSQRTSEMNLTVYKVTGTSVYPVCTNTLNAYAGAITCNTSLYTGTLRAVAYRSASPPVVIAEKIISTTQTAFSSTFGLWISILIGIPIIFIFAFMSPLGAILGGIIALIPALYFGAITWAVMGGVAVLGGIVMHFLKRIG